MADSDQAYPGGTAAFVKDGLVNGAKAAWANAKYVATGSNGAAPAPYTGGPNYPPKDK
jgi:hypothetical protein